MPTYTRGDMKGRLNSGIKGKIGILVDVNELINTVVRSVTSEIDLRSSKRRADMVPGLFPDLFEYPAPADLKAQKIIALQELREDQRHQPYGLVTPVEFKQYRKVATLAVDDHDLLRKIFISGAVDRTSQIVASFNSIDSGGGVWGGFGDGQAVRLDDGEFVRGNGSLKFDISGVGGTTAGIVNSTMDDFGYSMYQGTNDAIFVWVKIVDPDEINSFVVRYGNDATNYNEIIVTKTHFNTVFVQGWNLLRFDVVNRTVVGVPDVYAGNYFAVFMNKEATKINEIGYNFDHLVFRDSIAHKLYYYSTYPWQDAVSGAWKLDATEDADFIVAASDEYDLFLDKLVEIAGDEVDEERASVTAGNRYREKKKDYIANNPSEALLMTSDYQAQYYI